MSNLKMPEPVASRATVYRQISGTPYWAYIDGKGKAEGIEWEPLYTAEAFAAQAAQMRAEIERLTKAWNAMQAAKAKAEQSEKEVWAERDALQRRVEQLEQDVKWIAVNATFGIDSLTGNVGGNGQVRKAATKSNIDAARKDGAQ